VTGIPPSEAQALRTRGDDYRAYQREVSAFLPRPPRRPAP
jgi:steroid 5-alpha reductase family enzyme